MAGGIGNLVFRDQNSNRLYDPGVDLAVSGVALQLYETGKVPGTDQPVGTTVTDPAGHYLFTGVPDGSYFVFIPPTAFTGGGALVNTRSVPGTMGAAYADDDAGENGIDSTQPTTQGVRSGDVVLAAGLAPVSNGTETGDDNASDNAADADTDLTVDFGFAGFTTRVGDFVWLDQDRDGLQDPGEPGVPNVEVQLFDVSDNFIAATLTAPDGFYTFTGLDPGSYYLRFPTTLFPLLLTTAEQDPTDQLDSDAAVATGRTPDFTVASLENQVLRDAGYVVDLPDIGDLVFEDLNADGIQDPGENGVAGVEVGLHTAAGVLVATAQSDGNGHYQFPGVTPGSYYLQFPPVTGSGLVLSGQDLALDDLNDSDPDPETGRTPDFTAVAGQDDATRDAGYHSPPASITGVAWRDLDKNGVRDPAEPVLEGVLVSLLDGVSKLVMETTLTSALGTYQFTGLTAQSWQVEFPRFAGADQRYQLTTQDAGGNDALDSDPSVLDGRTLTVTPVNGQQLVYDAGYKNVRLGLGNGVYKDTSGDGLFNAGEGVFNVTMHLFQAGDNPLTDAPRAITTTSSTGNYYFFDLTPGQYFVQIPATQFSPGGLLAGWISLPGDGVDDGLDDNAGENGNDMAYPAAAGIRSNVVTLSTGLEPRTGTGGTESGRSNTADNPDDLNIDLTVDFGFSTGMTLGNLVYADLDSDGRYDSGEGVAGVAVDLYAGSAQPGVDAALGRVLTGAGGIYQFAGMVPGSFRVHLPAVNFQPGQALAGHRSLTGNGTAANVDDTLDENGIDAADPASTGISSPVMTLVAGSAPTAATGENGAGSTADDANDTNGNLTVDFGLVPGLPASYTAWTQRFLPTGANSPSQDADGDGLPNGYEYLFHLPPSGGVALQQPLVLSADPVTGKLSARLAFNPLATDASPVLTFRADLRDGSGTWQNLTQIIPVSTPLPDGRVEHLWADLETVPALAAGTGFIRVTGQLDTNADTVPDLTFHTPALGWRDRLHHAGLATAGSGFLKPALFGGTVNSTASVNGVTGLALSLTTSAGSGNLAGIFPPGIPCYVEITGGAWLGHRFEIDEAATTGASLRLLAASPLHTLSVVPDLTGAPLVVRAHWTLAGLFPPAQFQATTDPATADQVLTYPRPAFAAHWLLNLGAEQRWVRSDDASLSDAGSRPVPPGEGLFVDRRSNALTVLDLGEVRPHRMARPLTAGYTLQTSGWPVPGSPATWALRQTDGFTGSTNPALADAFQTWRADSAGGQKAFRSFFLLHGTEPFQYWADKSDADLQNRDGEFLFEPGRAVFLQLKATLTESFQPCPWTP